MHEPALGYNVTYEIKKGELEAFTRLAKKASSLVRDEEPGALDYRWYLDEDGRHCQLYQRYRDQDALLKHLTGPVAMTIYPELLGLAKVERLEVYGRPSARAKKLLDDLGATYELPLAGFDRLKRERRVHEVTA